MKTRFFTLVGLFLFSAFAMAAYKPAGIIADFETVLPATMSNTWGEIKDPESFQVVANPLIDKYNVTANCLKVLVKDTYKPWGGPPEWCNQTLSFASGDSMQIDKASPNHYMHVKFLSNTVDQRMSFGLVKGSGQGLAFDHKVTVAEVGKWVELVIDLNVEQNLYSAYAQFSFKPDLDFTKNARTLVTTYIDEIVINDVATPTVSALPEKILADFETVSPVVNATWGNITDAAALTVVNNPTSDATNATASCLKVLQKESYKPWASGDLYCAVLPMAPEVVLDVTNPSHYLHFKYLSNKVGATINFEILQSDADLFDFPLTVNTVGKWVDAVIDLSVPGFTLTQIKEIAFSPNATYQTNGHTADEITYIDQITINNVAAGTPSTAVSTVSSSVVNVYPSVVTNNLNVYGVTERTTANIYSLNGKLVQSKPLFVGSNQLNVSDLTSGFYIVKLQTENGIVAKKFMKR